MARVYVGELGKSPRNIDVPAGTSVQECLNAAGINSVGATAMVDGMRVSMDASVRGGETITVTTKVAGG